MRSSSIRASGMVVLLTLAACGGSDAPTAAPAQTARRDALVGGPFPALFLAQAQFVDRPGADGKTTSVPGPAKLVIVRRTDPGWQPIVLEDGLGRQLSRVTSRPRGIEQFNDSPIG